MLGIISAQLLMNTADPAGYLLFRLPSVLVSPVFPADPSVDPARTAIHHLKRMSFVSCFASRRWAAFRIFLMGGVFSLWRDSLGQGSSKGLSMTEISAFVAATTGGLVLQYPIGWHRITATG